MTAPQIITGSIVRRHLERAGPTVADLVAKVANGQPSPVPARTVALVERVEQIKAWALESSAREAARLLTEGARRCLLEVDDFREVAEWAGGEPADLPSLRASGERLRRRVADLGRQLPAWPALEPRPAALSLAHECLDLAELAKPGFEWARLQRGIARSAAHDFRTAIEALDVLALAGSPVEVKYACLRNVSYCLSMTAQVDQLNDRLPSLEAEFSGDPAWSFFRMEVHARRCDQVLFDAAMETLIDRLDSNDGAYWVATLRHRTEEWASVLNVQPRDLERRVSRMADRLGQSS